MALIAWYPLNGDTKDYSGNNNNAQPDSSMPTISDEGKIGKCYSFNNNVMLINNEFDINTEEFTIAFWCNLNSTTNHCFYSARTTIGGGVSIFALDNTFRFDFAGDLWTTGIVAPNNKWTHVAFVKKNDTRMCYINGVLTAKNPNLSKTKNTFFNIASIGASIVNGDVIWANNYLKGKLNDYRIYNEALSAKQIKEIAQAKICHYTFNEELYENTTNLYSNYPTLGGTGEYENSDFKAEKTKIEDGYYRYKWYKKVTKNFWPNIQFPAYEFTPGKNYTISVDIKMIERRNKATIEIRHSAINNDYGTPGRKNVSITNSPLGEWKRYTLTRSFDETTSLNGTTYNVSPRMEIYATMANEGDYLEFEVRNYQVEEKDHTTPFTSNKRIHTLKDISGYNHDMTSSLEVSPIWKNDEQKSYVRLAEKAYYCFNDLNIVNLKEFTYSCWIRTSDDQSYNLLGSPTGNNSNHSMAIMGGKICFHTYFHTPDTKADKNYAVSKTIITDNQWHLATITYDNSVVKTYIDGKLENQSNLTMNFDTYEGNKIGLNLWNMNDMGDYEIRRFSGDITDVRIYATALSAEDIQLLYQPEISIDKANVIRCSEINERNKVITESIEIVSAGYGANQNTYKVSIGDRYTTTIRETGWGVTEIDKDNNISYKTFPTHSTPNKFNNLKTHVSNIPSTSTILLSTYDQPAASPTASNNTNCMTWINYLRSIGSTKLSGDFAYRSSYAAVIQGGRILEEVIDNSGMNSKIILNTNIKLEISQNGFNKDASISFKEFNEIPNIESGVHNLKLGDQILPVLIDMDNDGGRWARVFYHNCKSGTVLFSSENSFAEAKETNTNAPTTSDKYSILSKLESFRPNTNSSFEFKLKYPTDTNGSNIWKQTSNPTHQKVTGYKPIKIDWTHNYWGGLEYSGINALIDGSVNRDNWFYAIGAASKHGDGIPSCTNVNNNGSTANDVELWVRINNYDLFADNFIENVSISRNGILTAKEFREIY